MDTQTTHAIEDVTPITRPQALIQFERFLANDTPPLMYFGAMYQSFNALSNTVWDEEAVKIEGDVELQIIRNAADELEQAQEKRAYGETGATKPAEIYRKYASVLRAIGSTSRNQDNSMLANDVLTELFLSQSLPASELESPDWIDSYTGETYEDDEIDWELASLADLMERVEMVSPAGNELYARAVDLKRELGWSQDDLNAFMRAQGAFENTGEEIFFEDRKYVPPTLEKDMQIDPAAFAIATPAIAAFNKWRSKTFTAMQESGTEGMTWKECFITRKEDSEEVAELIGAIAEVAHTYDITTAAAIALKVSGDYGLTEADLDGIGGFTVNSVFYELNAYIEEWGEDVLEMMQDGLGPRIPTSDINKVGDETINELKSLLPEKHHNPMQTQSYILAYMQAISTGATLGQAENTALAAWREAMSSRGAKAYDQAWQATHSKSTAWRSFWKQCGPDVPRPKEHIRAIRGNFSGLVLSSGRKIDWHITALKLKNHEIDWHPGQKEKLKTLLTQKGMRNNPVMQYL